MSAENPIISRQIDDIRHGITGTLDLLGSMLLHVKNQLSSLSLVALEQSCRAEKAEQLVEQLRQEVNQLQYKLNQLECVRNDKESIESAYG